MKIVADFELNEDELRALIEHNETLSERATFPTFRIGYETRARIFREFLNLKIEMKL